MQTCPITNTYSSWSPLSGKSAWCVLRKPGSNKKTNYTQLAGAIFLTNDLLTCKLLINFGLWPCCFAENARRGCCCSRRPPYVRCVNFGNHRRLTATKTGIDSDQRTTIIRAKSLGVTIRRRATETKRNKLEKLSQIRTI